MYEVENEAINERTHWLLLRMVEESDRAYNVRAVHSLVIAIMRPPTSLKLASVIDIGITP